jgi:hypothetical protein
MMEALSSSETSVLTRATGHNIPEDTNLHTRHRKNLKSYMEKDPVSKPLRFPVFRILDNGQSTETQ